MMTQTTVATVETNGIRIVCPAVARMDSKPISGIVKCQRCKSAKRVEGTIRRLVGSYGRVEYREEWPVMRCGCGNNYPMVNRVKATTTEHKCDSRCTHAKGPDCNCSCGGKNHGSGW